MNLERVTRGGSRDNLLSWMHTGQRRLADRQRDVATSRQLHAASDNPAAAVELLGLRRQLGRLEQSARDNDSARNWVETSSSVLTTASDLLTRSRTLVLQGLNGVHTDESRAAIAAELRSVAEELFGLANTSVGGRALFAGTEATPVAFTQAGATYTYAGDANPVHRSVGPGSPLDIGTPGSVFITGGNPVFSILNDAANFVMAADTAGMQTAMGAIDATSASILGEVGRLGTLSTRLDSLAERRETDVLATTRRASDIEDADMADAIVRLRSAQGSYEATLSTIAQSLNVSLLNFLR